MQPLLAEFHKIPKYFSREADIGRRDSKIYPVVPKSRATAALTRRLAH